MEVIKIETNINGLKINYIKKGKGKTVLILPGWGTVINTYHPLIESISTYANVICLDMPGFGESDEPKESWDIDSFIEFTKEFIKSQNIKELDLIGHSNGGRIIIKLMSQKLDFKVGKIILMGSAGIVHKKTFKQKLRVKIFKIGKKIASSKLMKKIYPEMLENLQSRFGSADYRNASPVMKQTMVKVINEDVREYLPNIKVPTLLIFGEFDTATPVADAKIMEKMIPDAGLIVVKGCTHYAFLENPGYVNLIIKNFLGGTNGNNN